ncbi:MAG TPA: hypothetical protein VJ875_22290 [Pyrinomonadaceae bacterium]|nr:hypothetical protein [Pyrinomonadaceae bacterium]
MAAIPRAYPKNISSLKGLELTCENDEANLFAKLVSLDLGINENGEEVTAASYDDDVGDMELGNLIFEQFTTENDALSRIAIHQAQNEPLVCKGRIFINNQVANVLVFRANA